MAPDTSATDPTVRIRMYRQGLGDCHLLTLLRDGTPVFRMMIDCGVYQTVRGGAARMREIVSDVIAETGGRLDVLAVTHEHWDHISGFNQARALFAFDGDEDDSGKLRVDQVWLGWLEDETNPTAARILSERGAAIAATAAAMRVAKAVAGSEELENGLESILGFFGGAARTTADAMRAVKSLAPAPRYCRPTDAPVEVLPGVRVYVLGPPLDVRRIYQLLDDDETYHIAGSGMDLGYLAAVADAEADHAHPTESGQPFDRIHRRPFSPPTPPIETGGTIEQSVPRSMDDEVTAAFLDEHYVGRDGGEEQGWRRIDADWLDRSRDLALRLDNATNNTSLVLAVELEATGRVLLFVADAQVGSWLSWQELEWNVAGRRVTGPDLLSRTTFIKVGHHGSHNATLRQKGLESIGGDLVAFIPTDEEVAKKVGWGRMPLPSLVQALADKTRGRLLRADQDFVVSTSDEAAQFADRLTITPLFYELEL